jgi:hypothetical protein
MYALVPSELISKYVGSIHEADMYSISSFDVFAEISAGNPIENPLTIVFTDLTVVETILHYDDSFPKWTYNLIPFGDLPAFVNPKRFVGVQL